MFELLAPRHRKPRSTVDAQCRVVQPSLTPPAHISSPVCGEIPIRPTGNPRRKTWQDFFGVIAGKGLGPSSASLEMRSWSLRRGGPGRAREH